MTRRERQITHLGTLTAIMLAGGALLVATTGDAEAALKLRLTQGANVVTVTDVGNTGVVGFNGALGAFSLNVTTGLSNPVLGSLTNPHMDLNSVNVSGGAGTLTIELTDTDFAGPAGGFFNTGFGGTTGGTIALKAYVDGTNAEFGTGTEIASLGTFGPGAFSGSQSTAVNSLATPFSMTIVWTITHTGAQQVTSGDSEITVPEPLTLGLLGTGLLGLSVFGRRRQLAA